MMNSAERSRQGKATQVPNVSPSCRGIGSWFNTISRHTIIPEDDPDG